MFTFYYSRYFSSEFILVYLTSNKTRGSSLRLCQGKFRLDIRNIPFWKGCKALEQTAQDSGGVTPGKNTTTIWGHGLMVNRMVVLSWWLDLGVLKVFSELNNSVSLWFDAWSKSPRGQPQGPLFSRVRSSLLGCDPGLWSWALGHPVLWLLQQLLLHQPWPQRSCWSWPRHSFPVLSPCLHCPDLSKSTPSFVSSLSSLKQWLFSSSSQKSILSTLENFSCF